MPSVLLINPNSSAATTAMMVEIARACAPAGLVIEGATAMRSPTMIVNEEALAASVAEVVEIALREAPKHAGIIVGAFGDPGLNELLRQLSIPAVGLCESAMLEASAGGRRYGVATVTPDLAGPIAKRASELGLEPLYTGIRLTAGDPVALAAQPAQLEEALAQAVAECISQDGAQAVIIGGGPLGRAASALAPRFDLPIIAPIPASVRRIASLLGMRA